jgi:hypothetical protein
VPTTPEIQILHIQMTIEQLNSLTCIFEFLQSQLHVIVELQFNTDAERVIWRRSRDVEFLLT